MPQGRLPAWAGLLVGGTFAALAVRYLAFVQRYGATLLVQDQWDFLDPHFFEHGPWQLLWHQHGPHRQGVGAILVDATLRATSWDGRAIAALTGASIGTAATLALWLKHRLFGRLQWTDLAIPLMFLSVAQQEALVTIPNPSHGAVPLLLLMIYALLLSLPAANVRDAALLGVNAALVFTGFGFFAGLLTPAVLLLERRPRRMREGLGRPAVLVAISLATLGAFFVGWDAGPSTASCTPSNASELARVPVSVALPFARVLGLPPTGAVSAAALLIPIAMAWALFASLRPLRRDDSDSASLVTAVLLGFALLFGGAVALGRACLVSETTYQSRYVPLVIPGFLGLYFAGLSLGSARARALLGALFVLGLGVAEFALRDAELRQARSAYRGKVRWAACALARRDPWDCSQRVGFRVHPLPAQSGIAAKLALLERRGLSLYHPRQRERIRKRAAELMREDARRPVPR